MKAAVRKAATPRRHTTPQRRLVTQYPRRRVLSLAAGAAAVPSVSRISWAQAYPTRPIKIVVPYAPGGSSDVIARNVAERMRASLGQPILIENSACNASISVGSSGAILLTRDTESDSRAVVARDAPPDSIRRSAHDVAVGRATSRAYSRDQSIPSTSAASCDALNRITPSLIGGRRNALAPAVSRTAPGRTRPRRRFLAGPPVSTGRHKSSPKTDHAPDARGPRQRDFRHLCGSLPASWPPTPGCRPEP